MQKQKNTKKLNTKEKTNITTYFVAIINTQKCVQTETQRQNELYRTKPFQQ